MLFAYFGPETILPLTSAVAGVVGVVMMFGRNTFRILLWPVRQLMSGQRQSTAAPSKIPAPHMARTSSALDRRRSRARSESAAAPKDAGH